MSGDIASSERAKQRYEKKQNDLSNYEKRLGLPPIPSERSECRYLNITGDEINRYTSEQCEAAATDLAAYGVYIQRELSRERSIVKWLEARIRLTIANELHDYQGYYSNEQRRDVAIVNNVYAKELEEFRITSQGKIDMLDGLTYQINQLCRVLLESLASKRQQRYS